jgi:hypothetical protein
LTANRVPRSVYLWALVALSCLIVAELGRLAGFVPRAVLDDLFTGAAVWWNLPGIVQVVNMLAYAAFAVVIARRLLAGSAPPQHWTGRLLVGAVVLLGVFLCLNQFAEMENVVSQTTDFGTIHTGSRALWTGDDPYAATSNGYFYPPLLAFLFGLVSWLPPAGASLLFFTLKFVMVVWTLAACDRLVEGFRFSGGRRALFLFGLIFVAARFWVTDLQFGNTNVPIMFLVVGAVFWDRADRPWAAGLALAVAASVKILPVVLCLHFLMLGRWRTLGWFAGGMLVLNLIPFVFLQGHWWQAWEVYFNAGVAGKLSQRLAQPDNQSLWGFINRLFPAQPLPTLRMVWFGAAALLGAFAGWVSWRSRPAGSRAAVTAAAMYPLLGLMVSPGSWVVHYTAVLLPMAILWEAALAGRWAGPGPWFLFAAANLAFTASGWARWTVHASITQSWFVVAAVILMGALGVGANNDRRGR